MKTLNLKEFLQMVKDALKDAGIQANTVSVQARFSDDGDTSFACWAHLDDNCFMGKSSDYSLAILNLIHEIKGTKTEVEIEVAA